VQCGVRTINGRSEHLMLLLLLLLLLSAVAVA